MRSPLVALILAAAGAILGAALAAQTWTPPRTWTSGEVLTADALNTHVRDNLLALRNETIGSDRIQTATGTFTAEATGVIQQQGPDTPAEHLHILVTHDTSFLPIFSATTSTCSMRPTDGAGRLVIVCQSTSTITVTWTYITASDRPSVWAALDADGAVVALWIAEDPPPTEPPLAGGIDLGPPGVDVLAALYRAAGAAGAEALDALTDYAQSRDWLDEPPVDVAEAVGAVPERYRPAARLWAVRHLAAAQGRTETDLYQSLRVEGGRWIR